MKNIASACFTTTSALFIVSCAVVPEPSSSSPNSDPQMAKYRAYDRPASLPTNQNNVKVKVSLSKQIAYVMEGSKPLLVMPVSIGKPDRPTPTGNFKFYFKDADRRAVTHGYATTPEGNIVGWSSKQPAPAGSTKIGTSMPYWCEFKSAYGFHTGWLKDAPASLGCIRMHENIAPKFYRIIKVGTPLNISYSQPEDATLGSDLKRPIDAGPLTDYPVTLRMRDEIFTYHKPPTYQ